MDSQADDRVTEQRLEADVEICDFEENKWRGYSENAKKALRLFREDRIKETEADDNER